jgi:hypothetical protein
MNEKAEIKGLQGCSGRSHKGETVSSTLRRGILLLLFLIAGIAGLRAQTYYVFSASNYYYLSVSGGSVATVYNTPDYSCIWVLNNGKLQNLATGYYLALSGTTVTVVTSQTAGQSVSVNSNGYLIKDGTTNSRLRYYYNRWIIANNGGTIASGVTSTSTQHPIVIQPSVIAASGEDNIITLDETTADYSASTASYLPAYTNYAFSATDYYSGSSTSYTFNASPFTGSGTTTSYGTSLPSTVTGITPTTLTAGGNTFTWTWSLSATNSTLAVATNGVVTVTNRASADERFSLTAMVALASTPTVNGSDTKSGILIHGTAIVAPVIARNGNTITLTTASSGATIYYTTDGSDPTTGATRQVYTAAFNITASPTTIRAVAMRVQGGNNNYSAITDKVCYLALDAPSIAFGAPVNTAGVFSATATLSLPASAPAGTAIWYTTDGSDPAYTIDAAGIVTVTNGTRYSAPFSVNNMATVKAVTVLNGWNPSVIASSVFTASSGITSNSDGTQIVTLMDLEDHSWSYYSGDPDACNSSTYNTPAPLRSRVPCNVKIVYKAGGKTVGSTTSTAALGIDAPNVTEFDYYETLEIKGSSYPYTTIPNPFSKRPKVGSQYYGFDHWTVTSLTGGSLSDGTTTITNGATSGTLAAEKEITFTPATTPSGNGITITLVLEADWEPAYVVKCTADKIGNNLNSNALNGGSYERNFIVVTGGTSTAEINATTQKPVTITMVYPDGTSAGYTNNASYLSGNFRANNNTKFEYIHLNGTNATTYYAQNHDLVFGRGISNTTTTGGVCVNYVRGLYSANNYNDNYQHNYTTVNAELNYTIRIESGIFTDLSALAGTETAQPYLKYSGSTNNVRVTLGNDYDRSTNNNSLLELKQYMYMSYMTFYSNSGSTNNFLAVAKSGKFQTNNTDAGYEAGTNVNDAANCFYVSTGGAQQYPGKRRLVILGGEFSGIAGGIDQNNATTDTSFYLRMKGGLVRGSIYGAGAFAAAAGIRKYVITGGQVRGWIAGACNGTSTTQSGGTMDGNTYIYIGGNAIVGRPSATQYTINASEGGNVFGAGSGNSTYTTTGRVNNSIVVIADNAQVVQNVYGGGNYGYSWNDGQVHILGGTVGGSVFGGSNMKGGTTTEVYMHGGQVKGNIYGGSNTEGNIKSNTIVTVEGGTVGVSTSTPGSVFGGGLGESTGIKGNVDVTIGKSQNGSCTTPLTAPTIFGDVYGGSRQGLVNDTTSATYDATKHTYVTVNQGTIHGNVYGGGFGENDKVADVAGIVRVNINAGYIGNSVFGCNNRKGQPLGKVNVNIAGGEMENVYGGGNEAAYGDDNLSGGNQEAPHVLMTAGTVRTSIFGGGLGSNATVKEHTDVRVRGNSVVGKNVYGGGNAATVNGSTHVEIGGE